MLYCFKLDLQIRKLTIIISIMRFVVPVTIVILCLLIQINAQQYQHIGLDVPYHDSLTKQMEYYKTYVFDIDSDKVTSLNSKKWFFFVELQPDQDNQWISTKIELRKGIKSSQYQMEKLKNCDSRDGGVNSCYLTNKQFNYSTENIFVIVQCKQVCTFKISASVSTPYRLTPGETVKMDFENTAYSKLFTLDTRNNKDKFDQLRIILKPLGFLQFPAPIGLYLNQDESLPTRDRHDIKGMTLWDNGQGIFLDQPDATGIFTLIIEGPQKNVLQLSTELVSFQKTYNLQSNLPYFDYIGQGSHKNYKAKVDSTKGCIFQITTFSGAVKLIGIYDENMALIDKQFPTLSHSYAELQYRIPPKFFSDNRDDYQIDSYLIFKIEGVKESTFLVESYQLVTGISHLNPQINRYVELPSMQYTQYYIDLVELNSPQFKQSQFQIVFTSQSKKLNIRFFTCIKDHGNECELKNSQLTSTQMSNPQIKEYSHYIITEHLMNGVQIFKFKVTSKEFKRVDNDTKRYLLTVVILNEQSTEQLFTIQYINYGKNIYLKEGAVKTDSLIMDQNKYYVFTNTNPDVKEIRIHVMEISGRVFLEGYTQDPRHEDVEGKQIQDYHNSVIYNGIKENKTIYLKVTGKQTAYYSVQLQLIKQTEKKQSNKTENKGKGYNQVILVQDIPYEFHIKVNQSVVYQLHAKKDEFILDISSLLPLQMCMTEDMSLPPFPPNCEQIKNVTKNIVLDVHMEKGNIGNIGVQNKNDREVKFNIRFTSKNNSQDDSQARCYPSVMGKITKYNIKKDSLSCYSYFINKNDDVEVILDVLNDQYENVNTMVEVNGVEKVQVIGTTHIFPAIQLQKACGSKIIKNCPIKLFINSSVDTEIRFTIQSLSETIYLLDGIANTFSGSSNKRSFVYELYNKVNTTVILENRNGIYKFYGKIVEANDYWNQKTQFPSANQKTIESLSPFYYTYQIAIITQDDIKVANCSQCLLLLSVEKETDSFDHQKTKFIIECTQQDKILKQNKPVASYIGKRSLAFYEFYNSQNGSILVTVNSQNQNCVNIFMRKGSQSRATGSDFDKRSSKSSLYYEDAEENAYSISLQALDDCHYSIDVTTSARNLLNTIQRGLYTDITLQKDQTVKYIYQHDRNDTFKILTLHQNGELIIRVKTYPSVKDLLLQNNSTKQKYQWIGKDYLRIDSNDTKNFCANCFYMIVITAERQTKSSIIIPSMDSQFPIVIDSMIKDELKRQQSEKLRILTDKVAQFQINVQYGLINILVIDSISNKIEMNQTYNAQKATQYANFTRKETNSSAKNIIFIRSTRIIISAIEDTGFSFGLISDTNESNRGLTIKYGIPQFITLDKNSRKCLRGVFDDASEQFLVSISRQNSTSIMNNLYLECTINNNLLQLNKNIAKNEMIITVENPPKNIPANYQFCLTLNETIFLTFIQSSKLNYFPQNNNLMVSKEMNLSMYADGTCLIQINECTSRAAVTISTSFNQVAGMNSNIKQIRKANNLIEFTYYGPVYIHVKAATATISWRKIDPQTGRGTGYNEYITHKIRIDKSDSSLIVEVFPLMHTTSSSTLFEYVKYTAYLAEEEMQLYDAMNCHNGNYLSQGLSSSMQIDAMDIKFDIKTILQKFGTKKYVLVGVLADAKPHNDSDHNYRFVYSYQQVPLRMLQQDKQTNSVNPNAANSITNSHNAMIQALLYVALAFLILFMAILIYRRWIKNIIKRHRREHLSDQTNGEVQYQQFTSYT